MLLSVDSKALMGILRHNLENQPWAIKHSCHPTSVLLHTVGTYTPGYIKIRVTWANKFATLVS